MAVCSHGISSVRLAKWWERAEERNADVGICQCCTAPTPYRDEMPPLEYNDGQVPEGGGVVGIVGTSRTGRLDGAGRCKHCPWPLTKGQVRMEM